MSAALKIAAANTNDIVDTIQSNVSYTKFLAARKADGLAKFLGGLDRSQFSRHTNRAFKKLPNGAFDGLLKPENRDDLVHILKYHAVAGRLSADELTGKKFKRKWVEGASCA